MGDLAYLVGRAEHGATWNGKGWQPVH
jgi:hypothetical protein